MDGPSPLLRAIRRARRREAVGRLADAVFASVITAATGVLLVIVVRVIGDASVLSPIAIALLSVMVGIIRWMFGASSDLISVASRLDQANQTRDLLASAVSVSGDDAWAKTLRAHADHASTHLAYPSPLGRQTLRTHLAAAVTLAAVTLVAGVVAFDTGPAVADSPPGTEVSAASSAELTPIQAAIRKHGEGRSESAAVDSNTATDDRRASNASDTPPRDAATDDATGAGHAGAGIDAALDSKPRSPLDASAASRVAAPGSGRESDDATGASADKPGGTSDTAARAPAAPWQGAGWAGSRDAALASVSSKDVPPDRREMVRAYFDR